MENTKNKKEMVIVPTHRVYALAIIKLEDYMRNHRETIKHFKNKLENAKSEEIEYIERVIKRNKKYIAIYERELKTLKNEYKRLENEFIAD